MVYLVILRHRNPMSNWDLPSKTEKSPPFSTVMSLFGDLRFPASIRARPVSLVCRCTSRGDEKGNFRHLF